MSDAIVGEPANISRDLCEILSIGNINECRKCLILNRNIMLKRVLRATSLRGILRASAEYIIETLSLSLFNKSSICSYLKGSGYKPLCKIPLKDDSNKEKRIFIDAGWIDLNKNGNIASWKNYPCLACSFFGTSGLRSLIQVTFLKNNVKVFEREINDKYVSKKYYIFSHQAITRKRRLFLEVIKKNSRFDFNILLLKPLIKKLYVKGDFSIEEVGVSIIWLSFLPINAGLIRFGRFKSRGLGHIQIISESESFNKIANILNTKENSDNITRKSIEIIKNELNNRLSSLF